MSALRTIEEDGLAYRVSVTLNGRVRATVRVSALRTDDVTLSRPLVDECNPTAKAERERLVSGIPEAARPEVRQLLERAADAVLEERKRAAAEPSNSDEDHDTAEEAAVAFPPIDDHPDPVDLAALLLALVQVITDHVVVDDDVARLLSVWTVHTYCLDAADFSPYLWVRSATRECGKSTLIDLLAKLARRATTGVNVSTASLFRLIEKYQCTVLLDDIDSWMTRERGEDIASILNSGFKRGARAIRAEATADGQFSLKFFRVFSAKVVGGIGRRVLADTTASRTIRIEMRKLARPRLQALKRSREATLEGVCRPLRAQAARWAADNLGDLTARRAAIPGGLVGRAADMADPLLCIAECAGGVWAAEIGDVLIRLTPGADDDGDTKVQLLEDLFRLFRSRTHVGGLPASWVKSTDIVDELKKLEDRPWAEWKGKGLSTKALADLLADFEISSVKGGPKGDRHGYECKAFEVAWAAYLPEQSAESAESFGANELALNQSAGASADQQPGKSLHQNDSADSADQTGEGEAQYLADERAAMAEDQ